MGGNFCYDQTEIEMMVEDCRIAIELGSDGLVYGVLTEENWLDEAALEQLLAVSTGHQVVFHMAFDQILVVVNLKQLTGWQVTK